MILSSISNRTFLGRLLRLPLRHIPGDAVLPIVQGRLRGYKWIVGSGVHGYWLGFYEYEKQRVFERITTQGSVVFDIGAHVGYYSLLASALAGPEGKVVAFEPVPRNLTYLKEHLRLNRTGNVTVVESAVSDRSGVIPFDLGPNSSSGSIALHRSPFMVRTISVDEMIAAGSIPSPSVVKIDVEGAEMLVLLGAASTLTSVHPTLLLATHGRDIHAQCCEYLQQLGYELLPITGASVNDTDEIVARHPERI